MHDCPGPRKPHAVKRPARPYKRAIQTDFLWKALRALNRPWAARTVPQCSCSSSKAARASACSSQTQRSPTFGQPSRRPVIAAASHRGGRLRFLTQVPNRREPKRESSIERELKNSIEREIVPESEGSREERETSSLKIKRETRGELTVSSEVHVLNLVCLTSSRGSLHPAWPHGHGASYDPYA